VTLEGRAGAGVILAVTRGPAVAFCTLAHIRGPGCYTFPMVAAVAQTGVPGLLVAQWARPAWVALTHHAVLLHGVAQAVLAHGAGLAAR